MSRRQMARAGGMRAVSGRMLVLWMLGAGISMPAHAQYVGRVDTSKDTKTPPLRATAVLEYTGDVTKPAASRLVPIAVWDGETYQPGGLYMAQPVPLTVESGTQYELEVAGVPKGLFDVKGAADVSGSWIAIGAYQKPPSPKASKLRASRNPPQVVHDSAYYDDKPHFAHVPANSGTKAGAGSGPGASEAGSTAPPVDPDRPTLHRRTDADGGSANNNPGTESSSGSGSPSGSASGPAPAADPDRPTLHKHTESSASENGAPVSATTDTDPDRPRLRRGRPENLESLDVPSDVEIAKLAGQPQDLKQMIAVSDAKTREPHNFVYSWPNPDDETKMQSALEEMAKNLLAGKPLTPAISSQPAAKSTPAKKTASTSAAKTTPGNAAGAKTGTKTGTAAHRAAKKPAPPPLPELADEEFKAYELTFGGGATLVFTAKSTMPDGKVKYVTLIAQPDFNGVPQVIFKQVTSDTELNVIPRMQLVDAADTEASNRGDLIFELAGKTDRQYAIYRVGDRSVEQVFSTGGNG